MEIYACYTDATERYYDGVKRHYGDTKRSS